MSAWDDLASIYETEIAVRRRRRRRRRKSPTRWVRDDGGRDAAGLGREQRDCVVRAIAIETGKPYHEVHAELTAEILRYVKTHRNRITGWIKRSRGGRGFNPDYGCYDKVYAPYLGALGWRFIFTEERGMRFRAAELPSGRLIVRVHRHVAAVIDGVIHDTFNSAGAGRRPVSGYWVQA
jgi:hypothetical protein